ncbi:MAG: ribonuclease HII [Fibrobacteres bacterium]|nr:ribonuclease HII [Fibrobacterota bacterium]
MQTTFLDRTISDVVRALPADLSPIEWDKCLSGAIGSFFIGVDEAGRGPLAGPVSAAAVILPADHNIDALRDSKKVPEKEREELEKVIIERAIAWHVAFIEPDEIDRINILNAALKAMAVAVAAVDLTMPNLPVIVDGNKNIPGISNDQHPLVKGDAKSASVAAASILAKVARDRIMDDYHKKYPQYNFDQHKGYPTAKHYEMIKQYGASPIHRLTFKGVIQ